MTLIRSMQDLAQAKEEALDRQRLSAQQNRFHVRVATASCGVAAGALDVLEAFNRLIASENLSGVRVTQIGCNGLCALEPLVQVLETNRPQVTYGRVTPEIVRRIIREHIQKGRIIEEYAIENV